MPPDAGCANGLSRRPEYWAAGKLFSPIRRPANEAVQAAGLKSSAKMK